MDMQFETLYTPRHRTTLDCQRQAARLLQPPRRRYAMLLALVGVIALANGVISFLQRRTLDAAAFPGSRIVETAAPAVLIAGLAAVFVLWLRSQRRSRLQWLEKEFPHTPVQFAATEDRLQWNSERSGSWLDYAAIDRIFATPSAIGVMYGGTIVPLPLDAFADSDKLADFVRFLLDRVSDTARAESLGDAGIRKILAEGGAKRD